MPLPKPPAKKATVLTLADLDAQAAPRPTKRSSKTEPTSPPVLDLFDPADKTAPVEASKPPARAAVRARAETAEPTPQPRAVKRPRAEGPPRLFVLDTNVLMHDPMSLFRFDEHDVYLPMVTLEELDSHKRGMSEVARNARQVSRELDGLVAGSTGAMPDGIPLSKSGHKDAGGSLFFQTQLLNVQLPEGLPQGKADNQILGVVQSLRQQFPQRDVVLVSKDINMRIKARALGLPAEDYYNDKTIDDVDLLYTGALALPADFWERHGKTMESWQQGGLTYYRISGPLVPSLMINQFVYLEAAGVVPLYAKVTEITGKTAVLRTLKEYTHQKNAVWGVVARNREQNFALNLLMDPECDFVTLTGTAGTGKTLMTLAAGLSQVLDERRYSEIIVTRVTVPVGEDIGYLPGTEEEKMSPWMGALDDNLEVLARSDSSAGEWGRAATNELVRSKIKIKSLNFMRGRTFLNKYVIIDEAQNLTPKQMKTLITRAGPGTKIICLGNLAQIDTPYLTEGSSGLTYSVDRFKGWPHSGHVTLARGERSRLADFASQVL
ncbi:PhoH family protein [Aquabacterium sp. A7-Y]|uniref:PhoH family protein n=1 Tax=Aquabacterium sp. A7-Y TaxID=1349605 RepID=UPI00223CF72E|nr:PhoH family protein [Aquabacterium sp. A7-Y]MCW7541315.1 PhoH family protein [Aquabacterium sp. A7-Y]